MGKLFVAGKNPRGISQRIYFGLWTDVATRPTEPVDPLTVDALGRLTGDIAMKPANESLNCISPKLLPSWPSTLLGKKVDLDIGDRIPS
jgi:hypothetical protein